jgi:hypothetical protein
MKKIWQIIFAGAISMAIGACSRKTHPGESSRSVYGSENSNASTAPAKPAATKRIKTAVPKVIVVNDNVAKKTFDGRYYYDLEGHRYWRSNKDGKYYLFNKSMTNNPDFQKPQ